MRNSILYIMLVICLSIITPLDLFSQQSEENGALSDPFSNSTLFGDKDKNGDNSKDANRDQIFYDTTGINSNTPMFFNYQSLNTPAGTTSGDPSPDVPIDDGIAIVLLFVGSISLYFRNHIIQPKTLFK